MPTANGCVLVTGATGQLGSDVVEVLKHEDAQVIALPHTQLDITDYAAVTVALERYHPSIVINCAAFVHVDECERDLEAAFRVNAFAVWHLAIQCARMHATLVHISSDYVFDGEKGIAYREDDTPNPINVYGLSKLAGECFARNYCNEHLIVRTSGLYGLHGSRAKRGNFVEFVINTARDGMPLRIVTDLISRPTFTMDLATKLVELLRANVRGTVHVTNSGQCSWYEFACTIIKLMNLEASIVPITSEQWQRPARRPRYCVLDNHRLRMLGISQLRHWRDALEEYLRLRARPKCDADG